MLGPEPPSEVVRSFMERQRRQDTKPEMALRRLLFAKGYRYRVNLKVPGLPRRTVDVAFTRLKVAVFVDGCFWHSCPEHAVAPKRNADWWHNKLADNRRRDESTTLHLQNRGWEVVRVWEHEPPEQMVAKVEEAMTRKRNER